MSIGRTLLIALAVAGASVMFAAWLTSGAFETSGGKPLVVAALVVLPLAVAAKNGVEGPLALVVAFGTYFAVAFSVTWLVSRHRR